MFENIVEKIEAEENRDPDMLFAIIQDMRNYIKDLERQLAGAKEQEELWKQYACKLEQQLSRENTNNKCVSVFDGIGEFARDTLYPEKE